jgi:hypothetical protein
MGPDKLKTHHVFAACGRQDIQIHFIVQWSTVNVTPVDGSAILTGSVSLAPNNKNDFDGDAADHVPVMASGVEGKIIALPQFQNLCQINALFMQKLISKE